MPWKWVPDDEDEFDFTPKFEIEVWSGSFRIPGKGAGYLEKTWSNKDCPLQWEHLKKGDRVDYRFPDDWQKRTFVCDVVDIKPMRYGVSIQVKVIDIITPRETGPSFTDVMMSYCSDEIEETAPVAEAPKKVRKSLWKKVKEIFAPVKLND